MRIGLVRRGYSPTGGAEAYLTRLAVELLRREENVLLFSDTAWPPNWPMASAPEPGALPSLSTSSIETSTSRPIVEVEVVVTRTGGLGGEVTASPRRFAKQVQDRCRESPCDFLLSLERIFECDAYRAGDGVHAAWLERRAKFEPAWRRWFRRFNAKHGEILELERALFTGGARIVIANSQLVKDEIITRFDTPAERIHVVYNGVPPWVDEPGLRTETRATLGLADSDYAVLFAGSGWERKGLRDAIAAVNATPSATLLVAGKGRHRGMPPISRGRFLGPKTAGEMRGLLAAADVFILPTIYDPFSNACLEAFAAGLPVITTTANGFSEIIEAGVEGEVVEAGDVPALAQAVAAWAEPAKRNAIRARLLRRGAEFSIESNVARTLKILTQHAATAV